MQDPIREKEKMLAGIRKYLVRVDWLDLYDETKGDVVLIEASSDDEAIKLAEELVWQNISEEYLSSTDEEVPREEMSLRAKSVYALDELDLPVIL